MVFDLDIYKKNVCTNLWFYTARGGQEKEKTKQCKTSSFCKGCEFVLLNYLGVRQGGIPAPCCFVVYLELSAQLSGNLRTNYWLTMTTIAGLS